MLVFGSGVHCVLRIFRFLAFNFRFSSKNTKRFLDLASDVAFGFSFWVPVSFRSEQQMCASSDLK